MVDARRGTHDDGRVELLREVEGGFHHVERLLGRGRVEHGHLRERGEPARVLLGLRRDGPGIVGHNEHQAAAHAHVVQAHERVACHVQPHLLAREQPARTRERCAEEQLKRHFLVGGPLYMHVFRRAGQLQLRDRLDNFR